MKEAFEDDDPSTVPVGTGDTWTAPLRKPVKARNKNRPINRAEVQFVFDDGGYVKWTARKNPPPSRLVLIAELRKWLDTIEKAEKES